MEKEALVNRKESLRNYNINNSNVRFTVLFLHYILAFFLGILGRKHRIGE